MRVQTTEIIERAGSGERVGIRIVSVERLRTEGQFLVHHRVGNVVVVDELDRRSHRDRQFLWREREVVDRDNIRILGRDRGERQQRSDDRPQKHGNDQGTTASQSSRRRAQMAIVVLHVKISDQPASVLSTIASGLFPCTKLTVESPSMERSWSAGTTI